MLQRARRLGGVREKVESPDDAVAGRQQGGTKLELARSTSRVQQHYDALIIVQLLPY